VKYSYKLISEYIDGHIGKQELLNYLELLGLNPVITDNVNGDMILELETPANRGDLLSLIGVARDILPFIPYSLKKPDSGFKETLTDNLPVEIEDKNDCFYYSCRIVKNIDDTSAHPAWLKESMEKLGYRSGFNVVDISNYVMAETGQPLHIFDLDKIEGGIKIRRAKKGERLVTIDGKKRDLNEEVLVISDFKKVVAIAGIMGGENSEVKSSTKNILIESAVFNPVLVRRGSKRLGLATEASARFERGIDMMTSKEGMSRVTSLINRICKGSVGPLMERGGLDEKSGEIEIDAAKITQLAGVKIEEGFVNNVMEKLRFKVKKNGITYFVKPPVYRKDIREDVDVIEEIIRYKTYSAVPSETPFASIKPTPSSKEINALEKIKDVAVKLGFTEIVNMGLTLKENTDISAEVPLQIENPLSSNLSYLRTSLIPEIFETARFNINHQVKSLNIFELGKVYFRKDRFFREEYRMSFLSVNSGDFFLFKGRVEELLEKSGIKNTMYKKLPAPFYGEENLDIYLDEVKIGHIFIPAEEIKTIYDLRKEVVYAGEIYMERILNNIFPAEISFEELPKYPSSIRDFSFIFPENVAWEDIRNLILSLDLPIEKIDFFDFYKDVNIPKGSISISFSIVFRYPSKTLDNEEVTVFSHKIISAIGMNLKGYLRGESANA